MILEFGTAQLCLLVVDPPTTKFYEDIYHKSLLTFDSKPTEQTMGHNSFFRCPEKSRASLMMSKMWVDGYRINQVPTRSDTLIMLKSIKPTMAISITQLAQTPSAATRAPWSTPSATSATKRDTCAGASQREIYQGGVPGRNC